MGLGQKIGPIEMIPYRAEGRMICRVIAEDQQPGGRLALREIGRRPPLLPRRSQRPTAGWRSAAICAPTVNGSNGCFMSPAVGAPPISRPYP
jgi:hypothetical protein